MDLLLVSVIPIWSGRLLPILASAIPVPFSSTPLASAVILSSLVPESKLTILIADAIQASPGAPLSRTVPALPRLAPVPLEQFSTLLESAYPAASFLVRLPQPRVLWSANVKLAIPGLLRISVALVRAQRWSTLLKQSAVSAMQPETLRQNQAVRAPASPITLGAHLLSAVIS